MAGRITKKRLITHNGTFHADDLFACATLILLMNKHGYDYEIVRTRDTEVVNTGDYIFDVGGIYDPKQNRFDHHQKGRAGVRDNGISYASFGLVWKEYGLELCGGDRDAWEIVENKIACPIDAIDNGEDLVIPKYKNIYPYNGENVFLINAPTWKEEQSLVDEVFKEEVEKVVPLLKREIKVAKDNAEGARNIKEAYRKSSDKRIVEIGEAYPRYLYQTVLSSFPEPIYAVYKSAHGNTWKVEAISKGSGTLESRKPFPKAWCGFINNDKRAEKVIGMSGVIFTHDGGFLANLDTKDNAYLFAKKALEVKQKFSLKKIFTNFK